MKNLYVLISLILVLKFKFVILEREEADDVESWTGKWFPNIPGQDQVESIYNNEVHVDNIPDSVHDTRIQMGIPDDFCDNGEYNLGTDFDPNNLTHHEVFLCCENKRDYTPNINIEPTITYYQIPPAYVALHKCMNDTIVYEERLPTFGVHRPLWPKFGEYLYVPPQRWLHALEHGAIVALYHPCANEMQIQKLRGIVKRCLRRHVISPSNLLTKEQPMALLAWGRSFEFSVLDVTLVIDFIQQNALKGPEQIVSDGQYTQNLVEPAQIVTTIDDKILCPKENFANLF